MEYKLKDNGNGEVNFITAAGSSFVKSSMPIGMATGIIEANGFDEHDKFGGFPIFADGKYFEGKITAEKPEKKTPGKKK